MAGCVGYLTTDSKGISQCFIPAYSIVVRGDNYFETVCRASRVVTALSLLKLGVETVTYECEGMPIILSPIPIEELQNV